MVNFSTSLPIHTLEFEGAAKIGTREEFGFKNLPPEIIMIIFGFLPIKALQQASQVSKRWHQISNNAKLWENSQIVINFRRLYILTETLACQKDRCIRKVKIYSWLFSPTSASLILNNKQIIENTKILDIRGNGLSGIAPQTFSSFLNSRKYVILSLTKLSHFQIITFFSDLISNSALKNLVIESQDLTILPPDILGMAISKLDSVKLVNAKMTSSQKRYIRITLPKTFRSQN